MKENGLVAKITFCISLLLVLCIIPCCQPNTVVPPTSEPTTVTPRVETIPPAVQSNSKKLTLADSSEVLDLLPWLPPSFERIDAAAEGFSNSQLGLGPSFSEVEAFLLADPFQLIYCSYTIVDSVVQRAIEDADIKNEERVRNYIDSGIKAGLEPRIDYGPVYTRITYPNIGELAVLGEGTIRAGEVTVGYDTLIFKENKVYVVLWSFYYSPKSAELPFLAKSIIEKINKYK